MTVIAMSSCDDSFLDRKPDGTIDEEMVFSDFLRASGSVTNIYDRLRGRDRGCVMLNHFSLSCVVDECKGSTVENDLANRITRGTYGPAVLTANQFIWFWWDHYQSIRECNNFLEGIARWNTPDNPNRPGDLAVRKGEVLFLRSYWHMNAMRFYGDFVYMDHTANLSDENSLAYSRLSAVEGIDKLIEDLDEAIGLLPVDQPPVEFGRAEKGAAMALKARLLYAKAMPMWNGGGPEGIALPGDNRTDPHLYATYDASRWADAAAAAKAVMDLRRENGTLRYKLFDKHGEEEFTAGSLPSNPDRSNVNHRVHQRIMRIFWDFESKQDEFIFILTRNKPEGWQTDQTPPTNGGAARTMPLQDQVDEYEFIYNGRGYPIYHPNAKEMGYDDEDPYRNRDPRFYAHFVYHGSTFQSSAMTAQFAVDPLDTDRAGTSPNRIGANNASVTGYYLRKCLQDDWVRGTGTWLNHWPLIRLPEIQLIYAEGLFHSGGDRAEIRRVLNELRARSFMVPIPDELTDAELLDYIHRERRVELFYENVRWFDKRWRLEPSSARELQRQAAYDALPNDQARANFFPYPRTGKQIHGMEPIRDENGKMEVNGVRYRMQRFVIEPRVFDVPRMYFLPLTASEIQNVPTMRQNPGW